MIGIINSSKDEDITSSMLDEYKALSTLFDKRFHDLEEAVENVAMENQDIDRLYKGMNKYQSKYIKARKAICTRLHQAESKCEIREEKEKNGDMTCLDKSLCPFTITKSHLLTDLRLWMKQVDEYFQSGGIRKENPTNMDLIASQRAHLARSLDIDVLKMLD